MGKHVRTAPRVRRCVAYLVLATAATATSLLFWGLDATPNPPAWERVSDRVAGRPTAPGALRIAGLNAQRHSIDRDGPARMRRLTRLVLTERFDLVIIEEMENNQLTILRDTHSPRGYGIVSAGGRLAPGTISDAIVFRSSTFTLVARGTYRTWAMTVLDPQPRLTKRPYAVLRRPTSATLPAWTIAAFVDHPPPNLRGNKADVRRDSRARTLRAISQVRRQHHPGNVVLGMDANTTSTKELSQVERAGLRNMMGRKGYREIDQLWVGGSAVTGSAHYRRKGMERITDHRVMVLATLSDPASSTRPDRAAGPTGPVAQFPDRHHR